MSLKNEMLGPGNTTFYLGGPPLILIVFSVKNINGCVRVYVTALGGGVCLYLLESNRGIPEEIWKTSIHLSEL